MSKANIVKLSDLYENWFLDYASYVILERALPKIEDGLKPVQRRILHAMKKSDDGRFTKVANIIGNTMQYHPHGDASIADAIVNIGQKELLIDTQGNWGDIRTGDSAAAARYIEARLSKFALEIAFNADTTEWINSYDGRNKEPVTLPVKFPLLLMMGVEGIAVGLATKIMPHNFVEVIKASISVLKKEEYILYPDFMTGGMADFSNYNEGKKGSKIKIRSTIDISEDKKSLIIRDVPYGVTTAAIVDSIVKANDKGKLKIKKIVDNTAKNVEIEIELHKNTSPYLTLDALYAFTNCEVSISPNIAVIVENKPRFLSVNDILEFSTNNTLNLLQLELEIKKLQLQDKWHLLSLEKIFIENRIYIDIEDAETWKEVLQTIDQGLNPFKHLLKREVKEEDLVRLTEIKIKRISKYDSFKANELINQVEDELEQVNYNLNNIVDFTIDYFKNLLNKYQKGRERKTKIKNFDDIEASEVVIANEKLYVDKKEGFVGYGLKDAEFVSECSDIDDVIIFRSNGKYTISRVSTKAFVGKDIIHVAIFKKDDERTIYNAIYFDGDSRRTFVKRFAVTSITREREYDITKGNLGSKILYFSANSNGETEVVTVRLTLTSNARKKQFEYDFKNLAIKGRNSQGNILTRYYVKTIKLKELGKSSFGGIDVWVDTSVGKLNDREIGDYIDYFDTNDSILIIYKDGSYELNSFSLTNRYKIEDIAIIEKFDKSKVISAIYFDGRTRNYFVKRFNIQTSTLDKKFTFISEAKHSKLEIVSSAENPLVVYNDKNVITKHNQKNKIYLNELVGIKNWKSIGNKIKGNQLSSFKEIKQE